jgi:hypothetical protein
MTVLALRCVGVALVVAGLGALVASGVRPRPPADLAAWRSLVAFWFAGTVASGIALTSAARVLWGTEATVSATLQDWFHAWPIIPALIFLVLGHILWPLTSPR